MIKNTPTSLKQAVKLLKRGGGVAYPTETCWGLGVRADSIDAIERLLEWKGRPKNQPISLLIPDKLWLSKLGVVVTAEHQKLIAAFWPGPLTLLFEVNEDSGYKHLAAPLLGVRCSSHPLARELVKTLGVPLTSPSANLTGQALLRDEEQIREVFEPLGVAVLHDENPSGELVESTVLKLVGGSVEILRQGVVSKTSVLKALLK